MERRVHAQDFATPSRSISSARAPLSTSSGTRWAQSVATTQVYLSRVGAHEAVEAMRARAWDPGPA